MSNPSKSPFSIYEISLAAAMAALGITSLLLWQYAPFSTICMLLSAFPFTLISMREKISTSVLCLTIAMLVGFIVGGRILSQELFFIGILGISVGYTEKKHVRWYARLLIASSMGIALWSFIILLLIIFSQFRELYFRSLLAYASTIAQGINHITDSEQGNIVIELTQWSINYWQLVLFIIITIFVIFAFNFVKYLFSRPLRTINASTPFLQYNIPDESDQTVCPVPLHCENLSFHYPHTQHCSPHELTMSLPAQGLVSMVGKNGAGKSTTLKLLSGLLHPTSGTITRLGAAGLGKYGGTSIIFQRPESQILGMRVIDDINFGNHQQSPTHDPTCEINSLLDTVGLSGLAHKNTADLSGGQLQRLAIASALTRNPQLILSDESTSMLDPATRKHILSIYHNLSATRCVVHTSHDDSETYLADTYINIGSVMSPEATPTYSLATNLKHSDRVNTGHAAEKILQVNQLSHTYFPRSPWESPALHHINFSVTTGEIVAITGINGSGKTSLARIIAGLESASAGHIYIEGQQFSHPDSSRVLLATQSAATQLYAATVYDELCAYAPHSQQECCQALAVVGLPKDILFTHPHNLSGGQQKRVVLAALIAARPKILILDEPLAGCDQQSCQAINAAITHLASQGITILVITHDLTMQSHIFTRHITLEEGKIIHDTSSSDVSLPVSSPADKHMRYSPLRLRQIYSRVLPNDSVAHRLWVGTKLYAMIAMTIAIFLRPDWYMFTTIGIILGIWSWMAKLPLYSLPRPSLKFISFFILGKLGIIFGSKEHMIHLGYINISLSGINLASKIAFLGIAMIFSYILFSYTTPLSNIPSFLQRIITRFPRSHFLSAICLGITLTLRQLSILGKEIFTMRELSQLRSHERKTQGIGKRLLYTELNVSIQSCALAIRLAQEMSLAITSRGGISTIGSTDIRPQVRDYLVMCGITLLLAFAVIVPYVTPHG